MFSYGLSPFYIKFTRVVFLMIDLRTQRFRHRWCVFVGRDDPTREEELTNDQNSSPFDADVSSITTSYDGEDLESDPPQPQLDDDVPDQCADQYQMSADGLSTTEHDGAGRVEII